MKWLTPPCEPWETHRFCETFCRWKWFALKNVWFIVFNIRRLQTLSLSYTLRRLQNLAARRSPSCLPRFHWLTTWLPSPDCSVNDRGLSASLKLAVFLWIAPRWRLAVVSKQVAPSFLDNHYRVFIAWKICWGQFLIWHGVEAMPPRNNSVKFHLFEGGRTRQKLLVLTVAVFGSVTRARNWQVQSQFLNQSWEHFFPFFIWNISTCQSREVDHHRHSGYSVLPQVS